MTINKMCTNQLDSLYPQCLNPLLNLRRKKKPSDKRWLREATYSDQRKFLSNNALTFHPSNIIAYFETGYIGHKHTKEIFSKCL